VHVLQKACHTTQCNVPAKRTGLTRFTLLICCAQAAGLSSLLRDPNAQNTIFAPSDDAFDNLQRQIEMSTPELLANTNLVTQVQALPGWQDV
jgi:uncharacterized surface protein with fasciclin (FAS1) repeats